MRKQTKLWKPKDGKKLRICDMTDNHLNNTITFLKRQAKAVTSDAIFSGYSILNCLQSEMAIDCLERDLSYLEEYGLEPSDFCSLYSNLVDEKERRMLVLENSQKRQKLTFLK